MARIAELEALRAFRFQVEYGWVAAEDVDGFDDPSAFVADNSDTEAVDDGFVMTHGGDVSSWARAYRINGRVVAVDDLRNEVADSDRHHRADAYYLETTLVLSTRHLPPSVNTTPDFGALYTFGHQHGWMVMVPPDSATRAAESIRRNGVPLWLQPVYQLALRNAATLVHFDTNADAVGGLPQYDW